MPFNSSGLVFASAHSWRGNRWGGWCTVDSEGWGTDGALVTAVFWGSSMQQMCESRADVEESACVRGGGLISAHV